MANNAVIVAAEIGGLGNRFKAWASAMRMSPDARVYWPVNEVMPASFSQMFDNDCGVDELPENAQVYRSWRLHLEPEDLQHLPRGFTAAGSSTHPLIRGLGKTWWQLSGRRDDHYCYMIFPKSHSRRLTRADGRHIDLEYERIPGYFRNLYGELFGRIRVRPEILRRADEWAAANLEEDVVGVQVRSWRDDAKRHRKYHLPSMKRLHALMSTVDPAVRFLVVSDSDQVARDLGQVYGDRRMLQYSRDTEREASWTGPEGIIEDFIDMLLLSRTERMFASYLSTFGEAAWWFGGARARVDVF